MKSIREALRRWIPQQADRPACAAGSGGGAGRLFYEAIAKFLSCRRAAAAPPPAGHFVV
ncbi:hypothetical protein [Ensifer adhaerens]|uniref:hypothetical protein n=1 Tax=Ensifer adhaerens TaxID=106592 RepID=UPI0013792549|nr:hypothetical protein [Ensifer adhaerens]